MMYTDLSAVRFSSCVLAVVSRAEMLSNIPEQGQGCFGGEGRRLPYLCIVERVCDEQQPARVGSIEARESDRRGTTCRDERRNGGCRLSVQLRVMQHAGERR